MKRQVLYRDLQLRRKKTKRDIAAAYKPDSTNQNASQVRSDVYRVINLVASSLGYEVDWESLPEVRLSNESYSAYDEKKNEILISREKVGSGDSYSAEAGHFLRSYLNGRIGTERTMASRELLNHLKAEEFLDRAATIIAREKSKGTPLQRLFTDPHIDYSSDEGKKRILQGYDPLAARKELKEIHAGKRHPSQRSGIEEGIQQFRTHVSYSRADQYTANELIQIPNLYTLPDEEILSSFVRAKKGRLDTILGSIFIVLSIGIIFGKLVLTGAVTGSVNNSLNFWVIFLFILGLFMILKGIRR